ncbi:unnamed protein product [Trichogramma brassicae]|uniref:Retrotransposon gag domain-containing protein n=1 Tax=Trichogramma brassicae TaxID=86971 RepID=A0A6H5IU38_9HYME|nr:unnamed protein product [Trichogramma brassicae]
MVIKLWTTCFCLLGYYLKKHKSRIIKILNFIDNSCLEKILVTLYFLLHLGHPRDLLETPGSRLFPQIDDSISRDRSSSACGRQRRLSVHLKQTDWTNIVICSSVHQNTTSDKLSIDDQNLKCLHTAAAAAAVAVADQYRSRIVQRHCQITGPAHLAPGKKQREDGLSGRSPLVNGIGGPRSSRRPLVGASAWLLRMSRAPILVTSDFLSFYNYPQSVWTNYICRSSSSSQPMQCGYLSQRTRTRTSTATGMTTRKPRYFSNLSPTRFSSRLWDFSTAWRPLPATLQATTSASCNNPSRRVSASPLLHHHRDAVRHRSHPRGQAGLRTKKYFNRRKRTSTKKWIQAVQMKKMRLRSNPQRKRSIGRVRSAEESAIYEKSASTSKLQTQTCPHRNNTRILIRSCRDTLHRGLVNESSLRSHRDSNDEKQEDTEMSGPTTENVESLNTTVRMQGREDEPLENVERWINFMEGAELAEALEQLELKTDGSMFQKKARLYQWLSGDYSANDFVESTFGGAERAEHHVSLRAAFINTTCWEKSGETIIDHNVDNDQPHPMIGLDTSETVRRNLEKSLNQGATGANTTRQTSRPSKLVGHRNQPGTKIANNIARENEPTQQNIELLEDTSIVLQVEELKKQMEERRSENLNGKVASSTRLDPRASSFRIGSNLPGIPETIEQPIDQRRVNFQDTIGYGPVAAGDWRKNPTEDNNTRFTQNFDGSSNTYLQRPSTSRFTHEGSVRCNSDIGETVRKWRIQFEGFGQMSVESYIERIEECAFLAGLSDADLLPALSETLSGTAAQWFRSNRHKFQSWEEFCRMARKTFGMDQYTYQQLLEQIRKNTRPERKSSAIYNRPTKYAR